MRGLPGVMALDAGHWLANVSIPMSPMAKLIYFRLTVPEDAASVKLLVDQIHGTDDYPQYLHPQIVFHALYHRGCAPAEISRTLPDDQVLLMFWSTPGAEPHVILNLRGVNHQVNQNVFRVAKVFLYASMMRADSS